MWPRPDRLRNHRLGKPGAWPDEPWDGDTHLQVHSVDCWTIRLDGRRR